MNAIASIPHIRLGAFAPLNPAIISLTHLGERYLPLVRAYNAAMHLGHMASYRAALRYAYGRRVLDIGCGVGYGSFFLASHGASKVVAIDLSHDALNYASYVYSHPNLIYLHADGMALPFADGSFDFIFSSQVIEHVPSAEMFMREVKRLLSPQGFCLITAPNLDLFSPTGVPDNEFHISEMDWNTYQTIARDVFPATQFHGIPQHCLVFDAANQTVSTKPNSQIRTTDYVIQSQGFELCENMLCLGFKNAHGQPSSGLPQTHYPIVNQLEPLFWDPSVQQWVIMTRYAADPLSTLSLQLGQTVGETIVAHHPAFYRLECDVLTAHQAQVEATLCDARTHAVLAAHSQIVKSGDTLEFVFAPQPAGEYQFRMRFCAGLAEHPLILHSQPPEADLASETAIDGQHIVMRTFSYHQ